MGEKTGTGEHRHDGASVPRSAVSGGCCYCKDHENKEDVIPSTVDWRTV